MTFVPLSAPVNLAGVVEHATAFSQLIRATNQGNGWGAPARDPCPFARYAGPPRRRAHGVLKGLDTGPQQSTVASAMAAPLSQSQPHRDIQLAGSPHRHALCVLLDELSGSRRSLVEQDEMGRVCGANGCSAQTDRRASDDRPSRKSERSTDGTNTLVTATQ